MNQKDLENTFLASVIRAEGERHLTEAISRGLTERDFKGKSHRPLYSTLLRMLADGMEITAETAMLQTTEDVKRLVALLIDGYPKRRSLRAEVDALKLNTLGRDLADFHRDSLDKLTKESWHPKEAWEAAVAFTAKTIGTSISVLSPRTDEIYRAVMKEFDELQAGREIIGLPLGFKDLDEALGGMRAGQLVVIGARSSDGKSTMALQVATTQVFSGRTVAFFSNEMGDEEILMRDHVRESGVPIREFFRAEPEDERWGKLIRASSRLRKGDEHLWLCTKQITVEEMLHACRQMRFSKGTLDLVIVDYLQRVLPSKETSRRERWQQIGAIADDLKSLAGELHIPVLAMAQMNPPPRSSKGVKARAVKEDLRDSANIMMTADWVILIQNEWRTMPNGEHFLEGTELEVAKARNRRARFSVKVDYDPRTFSFKEIRNVDETWIDKDQSGKEG